MPLFRSYPEATSLEPTDAFVIDRIGVGTMYIEDLNLDASVTRALVYVIDGGGSALATGIAGQLYVPFDCTITGVNLLADQTGSVVINIWKAAYASYPPNSGDTICASDKPTISAAQKANDTTLTGWTTAISADDTLMFNVDSVSSITRLTITLTVS